jgi:uncharacterized surface protein with fasciclin (FAS1) repeats
VNSQDHTTPVAAVKAAGLVADVYQSNGVIHVIDKVLLPKLPRYSGQLAR